MCHGGGAAHSTAQILNPRINLSMKRLSLLLALGIRVPLDSHAQFGDFLKNVAADAARQAVAGEV